MPDSGEYTETLGCALGAVSLALMVAQSIANQPYEVLLKPIYQAFQSRTRKICAYIQKNV
jgi:hypothetical protein